MTRYLLKLAPIITPSCGLHGAIAGMVSNQNLSSDGIVVIGIAFIGALVLGVPAGMLFRGMSDTERVAKGLWTAMMIAYCGLLFALFFFPSHGLVSI